MKIAVIEQEVIDELRNNQYLILSHLKNGKNKIENEKYISREKAARIFEVDKQTIANFEKEGLLKRYGRGKIVRYSLNELKKAMGIKE